MSKKRHQQFEVPEELQHDPITMPEPLGMDEEESPVTPEPQSAKVLERTHPPEVKTMVQQGPVKWSEMIFRCVYDDAATARKVVDGTPAPDVFCPVCGNRMVRER